ALDRHIAEALLASLPITPAPSSTDVAARRQGARAILEQRVRGAGHVQAAAAAEGIGPAEVDAMIARQARASLYLDRMVAPMLDPSEIELRGLLKSGATPFKDQPFELVAPALARWYVGVRLGQAIEAHYQSARARVTIAFARAPR